MGRRRRGLFWLGCAVLALLAAVAALAPLLAPYDPRLPVGPPLQQSSREHPLGTDDLGRDALSRLVYGARASLVTAGVVAAISAVLSWAVGLLAGFSRRAEGPLMALCDLLLALPSIPLYLLVITLAGPSRRTLIVALALLSWPAFARVVRSLVLAARHAPHVEAARMLGASDAHIVRRHLLPATLDLLPTKLILTVRFAVFAEATLAFLGLAESGSVSWGAMLSDAFDDPLLFSRPAWPWLVLPPTLAIVLLVLATTWLTTGNEGRPESAARPVGRRVAGPIGPHEARLPGARRSPTVGEGAGR